MHSVLETLPSLRLVSSCLLLYQRLRWSFVWPELTLTCLSKVMAPSIEQIDQHVTSKTVSQCAVETQRVMGETPLEN